MASPYLNSGEAIVMTTSRIVTEGVSYEVMLTSERIFLIDSGLARLEPRIIPLPAILAVQGGKTPAQEPVITLIFRTRKDGTSPHPLNLLFSQGPGENRRTERDDWVRGLMRLSIHLQEKAREPERPAGQQPPREPGIRPMTRHGTAPEMMRPFSNVADHRQGPAPLTVLPETVPGSGEIPAPPPAPEHETGAAGEREEVPPAHLAPVRGTPLPPPPPPARVIIPQIIEELLPEKSRTVPELPEERPGSSAPEAVIDKDALLRTIPKPVRPAIVAEPLLPAPVPAPEPVPEPVAPEPEVQEEKELPEILRALYTGPIEPEKEEPEESGEPGSTGTADEGDTAPEKEPATAGPEPGTESSPLTPEPEPLPATCEPGPVADTTGTAAGSGQPVHRWSELFGQKPGPLSGGAEGAPALPVTDDRNAEPAENGAPIPELGGDMAGAESRSGESAGAGTGQQDGMRDTTPLQAEPSPVRHAIPPAREIRPAGTGLAYAAVIIVILVLVAAGAVLVLTHNPGPGTAVTPVPSAVPVTTIPPPTVPVAPVTTVVTRIPTPTPSHTTSPATELPPVAVPQEGVWVRISSTAEYYGSLGNTGMMRQVAGTGDTLQPIFWPDHPVLVSVQKKDNTGAALTVTVYRNGTAIGSRTVTSPMGTAELLIDPRTALAPGLSPGDSGLQAPA